MLKRIAAALALVLALASSQALAQTPFELREAQQRQVPLMRQLAEGIPPQRPGIVDVYVLGVAADGATDVFLNEARQGVAILEEKLAARGSALLANDRRTWLTTPLASPPAVAAAVDAIGRVMDKEEDVLVLFMTSHGMPQGLVFTVPPSPTQPVLGPIALSRILDNYGPKHRVVIVSACYSGVFVEPLKNDATMIVTAARGDRVSFGCEAGRDWTYFGDAFFAHGLKDAATLDAAYVAAAKLVTEWEVRDKLTPPSEPQFFAGPQIKAKLAASRAGAVAAAP